MATAVPKPCPGTLNGRGAGAGACSATCDTSVVWRQQTLRIVVRVNACNEDGPALPLTLPRTVSLAVRRSTHSSLLAHVDKDATVKRLGCCICHRAATSWPPASLLAHDDGSLPLWLKCLSRAAQLSVSVQTGRLLHPRTSSTWLFGSYLCS